MPIGPLLLVLSLALAALPAAADIAVRFIEGAPKDRFVITNPGRCALENAELVVDLGGSAAGLVFDVTASGAGVEVFQPFELESGAEALIGRPRVADGDTRLSVSIRRLEPGGRIAFTIDVDDTRSPRGITVSDSEIEGAVVRLTAGGASTSGRFTARAEAVVKTTPCP
jgi:hypothetical protein